MMKRCAVQITDLLIILFQKFRFQFSLSSQSQEMRVKLSLIFFLKNYQYRSAYLLQINDQKIYCTAKIGLLFLIGSQRGICDSISILEFFRLLVGSGGEPCLENQYRILLLKSITYLSVVMLSFQNRNIFFILLLNIQHYPTILVVILFVIYLRPSNDLKAVLLPFSAICLLIRF